MMRCVLAMALLVGSVAVGQELPKDAGVQPPAGPPTLENLLGDVDLPATRRPVAVDGSEPVGIADQRGPLLGTVKRPHAGFQHPDLNRAWAEYDEQIHAVTGFAKDAIECQFRKATEAGDLDLALKWKSAREQFERAGVVPEGMEVRAPGKSAGTGDRPVLVAVVIQQANGRLAAAYENVEKALVKSLDLDNAQVARAERVRLMTGLPLVPEAPSGVAHLNRQPTPQREVAGVAGAPVPGNGNAVGDRGLNFQKVSEATSLTPEQARWIADQRAPVTLPRLTSLSVEVAKALAQHKGHRLELGGVTTLDAETARAFAQHKGGLSLNGLTTLDAETARAFAQHKDRLWLNGLTTLSDEAANALAQHERGLYLGGLTTLTDEAAKALAQHKGSLYLNGLTTLTDEAAKALAQHKGGLSLNGLTTLSDEAAKEFAQCECHVDLDGVTHLSAEAVKTLGQSRASLSLSLKGLVLTPGLIDELIVAREHSRFELNIDSITTLTPEHARYLRKHTAQQSYDPDSSQLSLNGLVSISREVAEALIDQEGRMDLQLDGLTELPADVAAVLARNLGLLSFNGLAELSPAAAKAMAKHKGGLSLHGLTKLSIATRTWLELYEPGECRYDKKLPDK